MQPLSVEAVTRKCLSSLYSAVIASNTLVYINKCVSYSFYDPKDYNLGAHLCGIVMIIQVDYDKVIDCLVDVDWNTVRKCVVRVDSDLQKKIPAEIKYEISKLFRLHDVFPKEHFMQIECGNCGYGGHHGIPPSRRCPLDTEKSIYGCKVDDMRAKLFLARAMEGQWLPKDITGVIAGLLCPIMCAEMSQKFMCV